MIDLKIGKYRIYTLDRMNIALSVYVPKLDKNKRETGEICERRLGYFPSIKSALQAYMQTETASEEWIADDAQKIMDKLDEIAVRIENACAGLGGSQCLED